MIGEALIDVVAEPEGREQRTRGGGPFNAAIGLARRQTDGAPREWRDGSDGDLLFGALDDASARA